MESTGITVENIKLDAREKNILSGAVSILEDDTNVHITENRTTSTNAKSDRVRRSWQVSYRTASSFVVTLFHVCRNLKGFLFISSVSAERVATGMPMKNTVTGFNTGDGATMTFQLQIQFSLSKDIGGGAVSSDAYDVNYPLGSPATVVAYADGTPVTVSGYSQTTGIVTLSAAPANGAVMTADFEYAVPVMFSSKTISQTLLQADKTEVRSAQIEEIF